MRRIVLLAEDAGHEAVLRALLEQRLSGEFQVPVEVIARSVRGGFGRVESEFRKLAKEIGALREPLPDLVLLATDANCTGYVERKRRMVNAAGPLGDRVAFAIPDPHVERWLLLDGKAFGRVVGKPCAAPDYKCDRDRYKELLADAVRESGIEPIVGGLEHAADIVREMNLTAAAKRDESFAEMLNELRSRFRVWAGE